VQVTVQSGESWKQFQSKWQSVCNTSPKELPCSTLNAQHEQLLMDTAWSTSTVVVCLNWRTVGRHHATCLKWQRDGAIGRTVLGSFWSAKYNTNKMGECNHW